MTETTPEVDYARIDYPSDKLTFTLKQLRAGEMDEAVLGDMYLWEQDFVRLGFLRELGARAEMESHFDEMAAVAQSDVGVSALEHLCAYYMRFGIANGLETAKQLIRRLEDQGADQARQLPGRRPG